MDGTFGKKKQTAKMKILVPRKPQRMIRMFLLV